MPWNSQRTDQLIPMSASTITINGYNGDAIKAYAAIPQGSGPFPGVVMVPHAPGWDEFCREFVRRLADHGFMAITPNIFERFGQGTPEEVVAAARAAGGVSDASVIGDSQASMQWLRAQPSSNGKVGVTGPCSAGRHAALVASSVPGVDAVTVLWGANLVQTPDKLTPNQPVSTSDLVPQLTAPMLGIFGNDDMNPSPDMVNQYEAILKENGKTYQFHRYDGAGHGIWYYQGTSYRPQAAIDGWNKMLDWFGQYLA
jgi:carboxymethylenebutenolidase